MKDQSDNSDWPLMVQFSGGRTSALMVRRLLDAGTPMRVFFENTGKECDETLDFIHEVETRWCVPVTWLEYRHDPSAGLNKQGHDLGHSVAVVDYDTAAREADPWTPFDIHLQWKLDRERGALPNPIQRSCTGQLKINTLRRYLKSIGVEQYRIAIGIRSDEAHRKIEIIATCPKYIQPVFPLCETPTTKEDVAAFWWGGRRPMRTRRKF